MPKDYAKYANKSKRPLAKHGWRNRLLWVISLLILVMGVGYGLYIYQHQDEELTQQWVKQLKALFVKTPAKQDAPKSTNKQGSEQPDGADGEIQFSFYTNLQSMQVAEPPVKAADKVAENNNKPVSVKKIMEINKPVISVIAEGKYILQIAAFRNPTAAGEMRISLLLSGFEVEVVKAINNHQEIYQLQQGPFASITQAKSMQQQLQKKGIESVIVKPIS